MGIVFAMYFKIYAMENPFEIILDRLNRIEQQLKDFKIKTIQEVAAQPVKQWMNVPETAEYLSISSSKIYKLTSTMEIPHMKLGKLLYFRKEQIDEWLLKNRVKTRAEIEQDAISYLSKRKKSST
jgi:excisionase family DNA binding protein